MDEQEDRLARAREEIAAQTRRVSRPRRRNSNASARNITPPRLAMPQAVGTSLGN